MISLTSKKEKASSSSALIVLAIMASGAILGAISYTYSDSTATLISKSAVDTIHSNAQVSAHDTAEMLRNRIKDIQSNIRIISRAPLVQQEQVGQVHVLFSTAQEETADISDSYFWIDKDGKLLWANSFENATLYKQFGGADTSYRDYYSIPKETLQPYITKVIKSNDGIPRMFVAQPILSTEGETPVFKGVIVSSIEVTTLGRFLESQLAPQFNSTIGMLDKEGQILYSTDHSAIGQDVFGEEFQSRLPPDLKREFNAFLRTSLQGSAGFEDISYQGATGTLAYQPISLDGKVWAIIYVVTPHSFATTVQTAIDSQRNLSIVVITAIVGIAIGLAILVIKWNSELHKIVLKRTHDLAAKTEELRQSNESLLVSNKKLEQAYDDLLTHDRMQKEFINVAAHELRTPIQPILSVAELVTEDGKNEDQEVMVARDDLDLLYRNAKRLERLSSDILEVARIESGSLKLTIEEFDLCEKIRNVIRETKVKSSSLKNVDIIFQPAEDRIMIEADRGRIFEVISNLLANAAKFTKQGSILIRAARRQVTESNGDSMYEAVVNVTDTGAGIAPEIMPRLFSKFVSNDQTGGTGLGLYISKNVIAAHGGRIWGENNVGGKGATFGFSLPTRSYADWRSHEIKIKDESVVISSLRGDQNV